VLSRYAKHANGHRVTSKIGDIGCLDTQGIPLTLISTTGFHCRVWQSTAIIINGDEKIAIDYVIKKYLGPCSLPEIALLYRDYQEIKSRLGDIIPVARFVATRVDGVESVIAIAETIYPWFNIANSANEEEAIPLLKQLPKAQAQLARFIAAARDWQALPYPRIIDLYGLDNLVLDRDHDIKYMDSFSVFFLEDMLTLVDQPDEGLRERIDISLKRREYLEYLLAEARRPLTAG
jgi:hypothetical protein